MEVTAERGNMITWLTVFKSSSEFGKRQMTEPDLRDNTGTSMAQSVAEADQNAEQEFLATIANLPSEEQDRQLQKHRWYARLAQRQGIAEAEWRIDQYHLTGDDRYKF
jgi:hypothetical protein